MPEYNKHFRSPQYIEETIIDGNDAVVGTIRIKPVSVLWKPKGAQKFFAVSLDDFTDWITSTESGSKKTKS